MVQVAAQSSGDLGSSPVTFPILAIALALSIYILWRRYRSRRRLMERVAELETLSAAGRSIVAAELDISALCQLVAHQANEIVDANSLQIALFEDGLIQFQYWTVGGQPMALPAPQPFEQLGPAYAPLWKENRSILIHDRLNDPKWSNGTSTDVSAEQLRSVVLVPLISGAQVIGYLGAFNELPNRFGERELSQLTILANQAAAAISNARIFHQEQTRAAHLELVALIARQITAINDLDELMQQVVTLTRDTFNFNSVNIFGIDPLSGEAYNQASSLPDLKPNSLRIAPGQGLIGAAIASRLTILSSDTREDDRFLGVEISIHTKSEIVIPLLVDEQLFGVLDVESEELAAFSKQDQKVLEALAAQVAVAIHKARQFTTQRERAWITTAQLQVAETVSQNDDLESLANAVVRLISMLVGASKSLLLLWNSQLDAYKVMAIHGEGDSTINELQGSELSIGDWAGLDAVHVTGEMLVTGHPLPGSSSIQVEENGESAGGSESWLLPLVSKEQMIGLIGAEFVINSKDFQAKVRREILQNVAVQTAGGIESIRLQQALQEEAWVNTALLQVAESVNRLTDLDEILYSIVRLVPMLVGVQSCVVLIRDEDKKSYRAGPSHGISEMGYGLLQSFEIDLSEFPLLERQDVERVGPDATYYTFQLPEWMSTVLNSSTAGIFPLRARGRLVGVLVVGPTKSGQPLSGRRLNIVTGIAQQAAVAVVNDHLYKESAERSKIEQELNMALTIQSSLLPSADPDIPKLSVSGYWQAARQVSGDFYDFMSFEDGRWGLAIADVADKGIPAALFMALSRTILRTVAFNRRDPAEVLSRSNEIIFGDTTSDHFVTVFYAVWNPDSRSLQYANGGHNPPILLRKDGETRLLSAEGIALGVIRNAYFAEKRIKLRAGDTIVFYTDGVTEAVNEDLDEFGLERLLAAMKSAQGRTSKRVLEAVTEAIADHAGNSQQFDDITLLVIKM